MQRLLISTKGVPNAWVWFCCLALLFVLAVRPVQAQWDKQDEKREEQSWQRLKEPPPKPTRINPNTNNPIPIELEEEAQEMRKQRQAEAQNRTDSADTSQAAPQPSLAQEEKQAPDSAAAQDTLPTAPQTQSPEPARTTRQNNEAPLPTTPPSKAESEQRVTLSGELRDLDNGEALVAATVQAQGPVTTATLTNSYGFYSLTLPAGRYTLRYNYVGFLPQTLELNLQADTSVNVELEPEGAVLDSVEISAERSSVEQVQMSAAKVDIRTIRQIPALFGEVDVVKVVQFLPGIKAGAEGTTGFFVRGGAQDQNLILLDEAIIYNAAHFGGLFSIFNPDAVSGLEVYKGNFPAKYGGRLSSVLDISMKEGNRKRFGMRGGLGLISSRLTLEAPLVRDRGSFLVSGRRTYVDLFTRLINKVNEDNPDFDQLPDYYFQDFNLKANYEIDSKNRLFLSGYFGRDIFGFTANQNEDQSFEAGFDWGNAMATARWNHLFSDKLFMNATFNYTNYQYNLNINSFGVNFQAGSSIQDMTSKLDFDWFPTNPAHQFKFGFHHTYHQFEPSTVRIDIEDRDNPEPFVDELDGHELAAFAGWQWEVDSRLKLDLGLRLSGWVSAIREADSVDGQAVPDTAGRALYLNPEPRLGLRYKLSTQMALKASYARMAQYVHLVSPSSVGLPTDIWYPSTQRLRPQLSDQVAAGFTYLLKDPALEFTVEAYYKWLYNQVDVRNGGDIFANDSLQYDLAFGSGRTYGAEFLVESKKGLDLGRLGNLTGWVAYTLAWSDRTFFNPNDVRFTINEGEPFPFRFDRRHDLSVILNWNISPRWTFTTAFVYRTGEAVTLTDQLVLNNDLPGFNDLGLDNTGFNLDIPTPNVRGRNNYRLPDYHRLDLSLTYNFRKKNRLQHSLNFSVYNTYNRANPFFFFLDPVTDENDQTTGFQYKLVALFPVIPSLTWNFEF